MWQTQATAKRQVERVALLTASGCALAAHEWGAPHAHHVVDGRRAGRALALGRNVDHTASQLAIDLVELH